MSHRKHKRWKYQNTVLLLISLIFLYYFVNTGLGQDIFEFISSLGYLGSFIAGIFFVSIFTIAPSSIVLVELAQDMSPLLIALTAGIGGVIGDLMIFRFFKGGIVDELEPLFMRLGGSHLYKIIHTPYFGWLAPLIGALIIASPFPDELGIGLISISKMKTWQFIAISLLLDIAGIYVIVAFVRAIA